MFRTYSCSQIENTPALFDLLGRLTGEGNSSTASGVFGRDGGRMSSISSSAGASCWTFFRCAEFLRWTCPSLSLNTIWVPFTLITFTGSL